MFLSAATGLEQVLEGLNEEQRAAATYEGGPLLVLAGAGTGKTTTLCARVAWLIGCGVAPTRVLLLTFTRRAAREMLDRTRTLVASSEQGSVAGGTFHSTAHRLICMHAAALGLPPRFGVLDASDAADLIDLLREEQGLAAAKKRFPRKGTLLDVYSRCVNAQQPLSQVLSDAFPWCEHQLEEIASLFRTFCERKRQLAVLDLDDLLLCWHALARDPVVGPQLAGMFEQVLVDEYQDLNALQVEIVRALRQEQRGLTAVGDDAQATTDFGRRAPSTFSIFPCTSRTPLSSRLSATTARRSRSSISPTKSPPERPARTRSGSGQTGKAGRRRSSSIAATRPSRQPRSASACSPSTSKEPRYGSRRS
jgi:DNA helicase II / ATP-dependent DNA helicase PcrA